MRFRGAGRPPNADLLVAAGLLVAALTEVWVTESAPGPRGMGTVVAAVSTVPLAWRRQAPAVAVAGAVTAILLPLVPRPVVETDGLADVIAWLVALHAINAYRPVRAAALGTLVVVASMILMITIVPAPPGQRPGDVVWSLAIFGAAAAAGQMMRRWGVRLVSERVAAEAGARAVEQRRLARELHDVVAHGVAVMVVQAGAAQELVHADPDRAFSLLDAVQRTGEQSAAELRRMLDLMGGERLGLDPQPRLADLPDLVDQVRAAGLRVQLDAPAHVQDIAPGLQATAYRVVQESLTNALKHGPHSAVSVTVRSDGHVLTLTVDDQGDMATRDHPVTTGHGLYGMQERVRLYGGTIQIGRQGSCWRVHASMPLDTHTQRTSRDPVAPTRSETTL
jgi:signal transduction histidine kinase